MEDLQHRIAPEPPKREDCECDDKINCNLTWCKKLEAYNEKYNPQIDWDKHMVYTDEPIYVIMPDCPVERCEYWHNPTMKYKWCYAKEYEEAEAIKKSIRPFGDGWKLIDQETIQDYITWTKADLEIQYFKLEKQFILFEDHEFAASANERYAEKTIKSVLEDIEK